MGYKLCKFCENHGRDTPLWGVYMSHFDQMSVVGKNFSFGGPIPLSLHHWGWNLAWRRGPSPPPCHISPLSVQRVAQGRKSSKSASCVT